MKRQLRTRRQQARGALHPQQRARARAIAIPQQDDERTVAMIHAALALLAPLLLLLLTSCSPLDNGEPVDYGPEASVNQVLETLSQPVASSDPTLTKVGAFVHFETTQSIAGQLVSVLSDTGQTVINRTETAESVDLSLVENKYTYVTNGETQKLSREFVLTFDKAPAADSSSVQASSNRSMGSAYPSIPLALSRVGAKDMAWSLLKPYATGAKSVTGAQAADTKVTYHRLETSTYKGDPPKAVREQTGCLGLTDCQARYTKVSFDQVIWAEQPEKIHFEFVVSPDVPQTAGYNMSALFGYYPGLVKSCVTLMVGVGEGESKALLTECQEVINFRFESTN